MIEQKTSRLNSVKNAPETHRKRAKFNNRIYQENNVSKKIQIHDAFKFRHTRWDVYTLREARKIFT